MLENEFDEENKESKDEVLIQQEFFSDSSEDETSREIEEENIEIFETDSESDSEVTENMKIEGFIYPVEDIEFPSQHFEFSPMFGAQNLPGKYDTEKEAWKSWFLPVIQHIVEKTNEKLRSENVRQFKNGKIFQVTEKDIINYFVIYWTQGK